MENVKQQMYHLRSDRKGIVNSTSAYFLVTEHIQCIVVSKVLFFVFLVMIYYQCYTDAWQGQGEDHCGMISSNGWSR